MDQPKALNPERTIEELLGFSTERLRTMPVEELRSWVGDAITRQDALLAKLPAAKSAGARVGAGEDRKQMQLKAAMAGLPPELVAASAAATEILKAFKGKK